MDQFQDGNKSFINGAWTEGETGKTIDTVNPFDRSVIATLSLASAKQLEDAFDIAAKAQKEWAKSSAEDRKAVLTKAKEYLKMNREDIILTISRETGGTIIKANIELDAAIAILSEAITYTGELGGIREVPSEIEGKVNHIYRLPLGVISSISPFNFPLNLSMRTIAPAIALGNSVVHKPDLQTALSGGSIIAKAFEYAGLPAGVLNVIFADIEEIKDGMLTHPIPRLISFTGSTAVGRHIGEIAGRSFKRMALELGGNNPFAVLSDADVDRAVDAAIFGKFIHQGQICMIINRIIVHQNLYDEFVRKFAERVKQLPYGDQTDPKTVIGPLINERQLEKALNVIEQAKQDGIELVVEGKRVGNVLTPFVFAGADNDSKLAQTELFAPIAVVIKASTDQEAIDMANDTEYGLSSAVFTSDLEKGEQFALQIDSGMTHVNDQSVNDSPNIAFGGNKASGVGRFGNPWVVEEFTVTKWISIQKQYRSYPF